MHKARDSRVWLRPANPMNSQNWSTLEARPLTSKAEVTMRGSTWWDGSEVLDTNQRVVARSDNEPPILALLRDVSTAMLDVEKASLEGDNQPNG